MRDETPDNTIYKVVLNHEEQYSIWPEYRANPPGWSDAGKEMLAGAARKLMDGKLKIPTGKDLTGWTVSKKPNAGALPSVDMSPATTPSAIQPTLPPNFADTVDDGRKLIDSLIVKVTNNIGEAGRRWMDRAATIFAGVLGSRELFFVLHFSVQAVGRSHFRSFSKICPALQAASSNVKIMRSTSKVGHFMSVSGCVRCV